MLVSNMNKFCDENRKNIIHNYIRAKDENRPNLMGKVLAPSASLNMLIKTQNISFPSNTVGLDAITDVLVRKFSQTYENVYTFCIYDSLENNKNELSCDWLVEMIEKESGSARVGCGRYNWYFDNASSTIADRFKITIEHVVALEPEFSGQILHWISELPYPWSDSATILSTMPDFEKLDLVRDYIS